MKPKMFAIAIFATMFVLSVAHLPAIIRMIAQNIPSEKVVMNAVPQADIRVGVQDTNQLLNLVLNAVV